jgi:acetylglutamate synthase
MELKEFIAAYDILQKKYKLPSFKELNSCFEIDKIDKESDTLLRIVRKVSMEKVVNLLGLIELFLSPNNVPRMYLAYLKSMTTEDKKQLSDIYDKLSGLALECMPLELEYSEKREAEMISKIYAAWNEVKPSVLIFFEKIKKPANGTTTKEKSYFG